MTDKTVQCEHLRSDAYECEQKAIWRVSTSDKPFNDSVSCNNHLSAFLGQAETGYVTRLTAEGPPVPPGRQQEQHNHIARELRPPGECYSCDRYWAKSYRFRALELEDYLLTLEELSESRGVEYAIEDLKSFNKDEKLREKFSSER